MPYYTFGFLLLLNSNLSFSQSLGNDTSKIKLVNILAIPIVYYTPDTRWAIGLAGNLAFYTDKVKQKKSNVSIGFSVTQNKQISLYLPFQLYFNSDKIWFYGEFGYYKYLYYFYGIGSCTNEEQFEKYNVDFPRFRLNALHKIQKNIYVGLKYSYDDFTFTKVDSNGALYKENITGAANGRISGLGVLFNYDTRDVIQFPRKGILLESLVYVEDTWTGSNFSYSRYSGDLAWYLPVTWRKSVLALQIQLMYLNGNIPFHQMAQLGGTKRMRGYIDGRFRGTQLQMLQSEFRIPLFWRFKASIFGGLASVQEKFTNQKPTCIVYNYGLGLRFELDRSQQLHLRLDYGFGKEQSGFYLTLGEAF